MARAPRFDQPRLKAARNDGDVPSAVCGDDANNAMAARWPEASTAHQGSAERR